MRWKCRRSKPGGWNMNHVKIGQICNQQVYLHKIIFACDYINRCLVSFSFFQLLSASFSLFRGIWNERSWNLNKSKIDVSWRMSNSVGIFKVDFICFSCDVLGCCSWHLWFQTGIDWKEGRMTSPSHVTTLSPPLWFEWIRIFLILKFICCSIDWFMSMMDNYLWSGCWRYFFGCPLLPYFLLWPV